ncbi:MAG: hypothetical protein RLP11_12415 [Marinoscillum sp.]|uniref:hypothetical protein n=1 Tax=Marinoscillum sp. TaxID=2024838 RepID=UPI003302377A
MLNAENTSPNVFMVCSLLLFTFCANAQNSPQEIIPPSPEAAAFGKYIENPISKYNGMVDINIPVYSVKENEFEVPISLNYHSSGIKVEEEATWVGLGWTLFTGGVITRSKRGLDDFIDHIQFGWLNPASGYLPKSPGDDLVYDYLSTACSHTIDPLADLFYFNFNGHQGKFILQPNSDEPLLLSIGNYKITLNTDNLTWDIVTPDGFNYQFREKEFSQVLYTEGSFSDKFSVPFVEIPYAASDPYISTWYLTKIVSPNGSEVSFSYKDSDPDGNTFCLRSAPNFSETQTYNNIPGTYGGIDESSDCALFDANSENIEAEHFYIQQDDGYSLSVDVGCLPDALTGPFPAINIGMSLSLSGSLLTSFSKYLDEISFSSGSLKFVTSDRADLALHTDGATGYVHDAAQKLDFIQLLDRTGQEKERWTFDFNYFNSGGAPDYLAKRLKLLSLRHEGGGISDNPHVFGYEANGLPHKISFSRDHWGYANGAGDQARLTPSISYYANNALLEVRSGANREPNELYAKAWVLNSITYPTGGTTNFFFESNDVNVETSSINSKSSTFISLQGDDYAAFEVAGAGREVEFNLSLYCGGPENCFSTDPSSQSTCTLETENYSEKYFELIHVSSGGGSFTRMFADFLCADDDYTGPCDSPIIYKTMASGSNGTRVCGINLKVKKILQPGKYLVKSVIKNNLFPSVSFTLDHGVSTSSELVNTSSKMAGLRIKKIEHSDGIRPDKKIIRRFEYNNVNISGKPISSGRLMTYPRYVYGIFFPDISKDNHKYGVTRFYVNSESNVPLGTSAKGHFVGYDKVTEYFGEYGEGGAIEHFYENTPDDPSNKFIPNSPIITNAEENGYLNREVYRDIDGRMVKQVDFVYETQELESAYFLHYYLENCDTYDLEAQSPVPDLYFKFSKERRLWKYLTEKTEKIYNPGDVTEFLETKTNYTYSPAHYQMLTEDAKEMKSGESYKTEYSYPLDVPELVPPELLTQNRHQTLIEKVEYKNGSKVGGTRFLYYGDDGVAHLDTIKAWDQNGNWYPTMAISYYTNGKPKEFVGRDLVPYTVLWAYGGNFPVAIVQGSEFDAIVTLTGDPEGVSGIMDEFDNGTISTFLAPLEGSGLRVSTFLYDPLKGVVYKKQINGAAEEFEYDGLGRVEKFVMELANGNSHTLKKIIYQSAN